MPQIGPLEILVVALVALVVFGPQRLPEIARSIGKAASELRRMASDVRSEFEMGMDDDSTPAPAPTEPTQQKSDEATSPQ